MSSPPIIEIKHLTKRYHHADEPAVKNLDMKINRGEIFGLLGPNGAGKTTTISILCSQIKADEGEININGKNLATEAAQIDLGGPERVKLYDEAVEKMEENPYIPALFRNIFKNAYLPYRDRSIM